AGASHEVARLWARWRPDLGTEAIEAYLNTLSIETSGPATLVPAVPEMAGLLGRLKASGLALGVATHDSEQAARAQLRELGVLSMFAFIAGYDSGHGLKPGPGMLQAFATATGVPAAQIAMVGDSIHDLAMVANAGGGLAVGVLSGPAGADDLSEHADHILPSIAGLPALLGLD
ncbi:MAG: HAD-IA family hydrolase, partial [Pseudomonadota bacterium]